MDSKFLKLKTLLEENKDWPLKYMFKFIVPNKDGKVDKVVSVFPADAEKNFKYTESMKYVAITCVLEMDNAEEIIRITESAIEIPGVMML